MIVARSDGAGGGGQLVEVAGRRVEGVDRRDALRTGPSGLEHEDVLEPGELGARLQHLARKPSSSRMTRAASECSAR